MRILLIVLTSGLIVLSAALLSAIPILMIILCVIFALVGLFITLIYLPVYFRNLTYTLSQNQIIRKSGFFFHKTQTMLIETIQFSSSICTPFSRITGLNFIMLYAYGGMMTIMFLKRCDFDEMCSFLRTAYAGKEEKNEAGPSAGVSGASSENN